MNILLRNSWQTVNIGDIAHSPGILNVLYSGIPDCHVILWATQNITEEVIDLIHKGFPDVKVVLNTEEGREELYAAMEWSDMLIHGSAADFGTEDVELYLRHTGGKPFGVFGVTFNKYSIFNTTPYEEKKALLAKAEFVFFRDGRSLREASDIPAPCVKFGCDGAFAYDITDEEKAAETMRSLGLKDGRFVCCIPRYRYTPYWKIDGKRPVNAEREAYNQAMIGQDTEPLKKAICRIVENTDLEVLICPEDKTQVALGKLLYDGLPEAVRARTVWKDSFWLTDEALSVYKRSAGLFGCEMHSPILCIGHGIPAIVARWKEQTTKGYMWEDLGLADWLFDFDKAEDRERYPDVCLDMVQHPEESFRKAEKAREKAFDTYREIVREIKRVEKDIASGRTNE